MAMVYRTIETDIPTIVTGDNVRLEKTCPDVEVRRRDNDYQDLYAGSFETRRVSFINVLINN